NAFYAGPGYDLCTGIGTPNGTNLINALINPDPLIVISNYGFNAIGSPAGTFNVTSQTFYLTNTGAATLEWSLINTSAWLDVSMSSGTLAVGASNSVVVSLNTVASNLNAGTYTASLWFSNVTSGVAHGRQFSLKTSDALVILPTNYFSFIGPSGGPFAPASQGIILTNARSGLLNWGINNTSAWFDVSPASGSLSSGAQASMTFTLTPAVTNLANGIYAATFQVTNLASQFVQVITGSVLVGQPLVQNGGFETGDFTSWTLNGDAGNFNYVDSSGSFVAPHSGTYCALLGESGFLAYLSQTLPTAAGQKYLISLWLNNPLKGSPSNPNEFSVSWNGSTLYDKVNIAKIGWTNMQFVVKATGSSTVLQIGGQDDNYYLGLDDVTVTPGFAPAISTQPTNLTILSGSNAVFSATVSGSAPLVYQWRKNGTNISNGGNISGATSNVLTLTAVTTNSSGNYNLSVTNIFGVSTSSVATLTVNLISTGLALDSSANPSGYKDNLSFTAAVTPANASGTVQFFTNGAAFDTGTLVAGQAASTNIASLPRGTNLITAIYSGDANDLPATNTLAQIVTNHPPVAATAFYRRAAGSSLDIAVADLATNWTDVDGDIISLAGFSVSTNGVTLTNNAGTLVYFNSNNVADQFSCAISDGWGGTNFQTVNITVVPPVNPTPNITGMAANTNGSFTLNLAGASGYTYVLETTTNLISSANWLPVATNTLGTNGVWQFNDAQATNFSQRFYRLKLAQ
ncbi:MAG TPA: hypothetical protein DCQ92_00645, partial [Verrucomicrobia subdivision 3 bacterium]|nr:hypothetical protein [Limisphaerales bacterium]